MFPLHGTSSTLLTFFAVPLRKSTWYLVPPFLVPAFLGFQKKPTRYYEVRKGDVKTLQTTDWSEIIVSVSLLHQCMACTEYPEQHKCMPAIFKHSSYCSSHSFASIFFFFIKLATRKIMQWLLEEVQIENIILSISCIISLCAALCVCVLRWRWHHSSFVQHRYDNQLQCHLLMENDPQKGTQYQRRVE